jgi:putative endonuclease
VGALSLSSKILRLFSLDQSRLRRVAAAAERLVPRFVEDGDDVRIDAIFMVPGRWPRHLTSVWHG